MAEYGSAKLREYIKGNLKRNEDLYPHTALVDPGSESSELLHFLESVYEPDDAGELPAECFESRAASALRKPAASDRVGSAVSDMGAFAVGITEKEVNISDVDALAKMQQSIIGNFTPYVGVMFGGMNTGKTAFTGKYLELWLKTVPLKYDYVVDIDGNYKDGLEPVVVTNMSTLNVPETLYPVNPDGSLVEVDVEYVYEYEDWRDLLLGDERFLETGGAAGEPPEISPDRPKWWHFDECSTHLNANKYSYEVAQYYLPAVKRFAKFAVDSMHLGHSGMDIYKDMRRDTSASEFIFKMSKSSADVYARMNDDAGADLVYELRGITDTAVEYDPDDYSPWLWPN